MKKIDEKFQSLFYWITYSYNVETSLGEFVSPGFNPYFIGLPILIFRLFRVILF